MSCVRPVSGKSSDIYCTLLRACSRLGKSGHVIPFSTQSQHTTTKTAPAYGSFYMVVPRPRATRDMGLSQHQPAMAECSASNDPTQSSPAAVPDVATQTSPNTKCHFLRISTGLSPLNWRMTLKSLIVIPRDSPRDLPLPPTSIPFLHLRPEVQGNEIRR